jgi:hypothetical protein
MGYFKRLQDVDVKRDSLVRVTRAGDVTEIKYLSSVNLKATVRKLDKKSYIVLSERATPEQLANVPRQEVVTLLDSAGNIERKYIKHYYDLESKEGNRRDDNRRELLRTFKKLRNLINANATHPNRIRWCTFTYKENMQDTKKLYHDWKNFNGRFKRWLAKVYPDNNKYEYIVVCEPQERGAWHMHVFFIFEKSAPFIENAYLRGLWGHGFVNIKAVDERIDDIGLYFTSYLTDIPVSDDTATSSKSSKKIAKGGRLHLYPSGFKFFRCSRGVQRPTVGWQYYENAVKSVNPATLKSTYFFECEIPDYIDKKTNEPKRLIIANWYYHAKKKLTKPFEKLVDCARSSGIPVVQNVSNTADNEPVFEFNISKEDEERIAKRLEGIERRTKILKNHFKFRVMGHAIKGCSTCLWRVSHWGSADSFANYYFDYLVKRFAYVRNWIYNFDDDNNKKNWKKQE